LCPTTRFIAASEWGTDSSSTPPGPKSAAENIGPAKPRQDANLPGDPRESLARTSNPSSVRFLRIHKPFFVMASISDCRRSRRDDDCSSSALIRFEGTDHLASSYRRAKSLARATTLSKAAAKVPMRRIRRFLANLTAPSGFADPVSLASHRCQICSSSKMTASPRVQSPARPDRGGISLLVRIIFKPNSRGTRATDESHEEILPIFDPSSRPRVLEGFPGRASYKGSGNELRKWQALKSERQPWHSHDTRQKRRSAG